MGPLGPGRGANALPWGVAQFGNRRESAQLSDESGDGMGTLPTSVDTKIMVIAATLLGSLAWFPARVVAATFGVVPAAVLYAGAAWLPSIIIAVTITHR